MMLQLDYRPLIECGRCGVHHTLIRVGKVYIQPTHPCIDAVRGDYSPVKTIAWMTLLAKEVDDATNNNR